MGKIFVLILNINGCKNTLECLNSLKKVRALQGYELVPVIIDNNSHDNSVPTFESRFPEIKLIKNKRNLGYSGGNNIGIDYALKNDADYIIILNNDTLLARSSVYELVEAVRTYNADVACPKIYFEKGFEFHKNRYRKNELGRILWFAGGEMDFANVIGHHRGVDEVDKGQYDNKVNMDFITGACFIAKRKVFEKLKGFNDDYFLYYEDADLSERIRNSGFKIVFAPKSIIYHKNAGSTGGSGSPLQDYYITRNRLLFGMKYAPLRAKAALFKESLRNLFRGRKFQKKGVIDFYLRRLNRGTYPLPE